MKNTTSIENQGLAGRSVVPILLLIGTAGLIAAWVLNQSTRPALPALSDVSRATVAGLKAPVEIRFYSGSNETSEEAARGFAERARKLVRSYVGAGAGKVIGKELIVTNEEAASAAIADGIRPFNLEKGEANYLGIVVEASGKKEALPVLSPDYEKALEADVTRAIQRVATASGTEQQVQLDAPEPSTLERVKTNFATVTLDEGTRQLREKMLTDLQKAGSDFDAKLKQAQETYKKAEASGNEKEMESARKALTGAELEHNERLKRIISGSSSDLRALEEIKRQ